MRRLIGFSLGVGLLVAGCGGPSNHEPTVAEMEQTALGDVGELVRVYQINKGKPPQKVADLIPLEQNSPLGLNAIRTGEVVLRLNATLPNTAEGGGEGPDDEVLAYQTKVPDSGGQVLMLNRTIKAMTPEEFKSAKLAGTSSSAEEKSTKKKK